MTPTMLGLSSVQRPYGLVQKGVPRGLQASLSQWGALLPPPFGTPRQTSLQVWETSLEPPLTLCDLRRAREPLRASVALSVQSASLCECAVYAYVFPTGLWAVLVPPASPVYSRCSTNVLLLRIYLVALLAYTACRASSP